MTTPTPEARAAGDHGPIAGALVDVARCLRFYSRLPVPALPWEVDPHAVPDFTRMTRVLPVAGAIIGAVGALVLLAGGVLGLPALPLAALVIAVLALATGAFHEDGLADVFDAFGGGATPQRRLEILKDSRIGAFGGTALALGLILRVSALAGLIEAAGVVASASAVVAIAASSRTAGLMPLTLAPAARFDGASAAVGRPAPGTLAIAGVIAAALSFALAAAAGLSLGGMAFALALAAATGYAMTRWSMRMIGGQTGDVAGAAQQFAEILALLALLIAASR